MASKQIKDYTQVSDSTLTDKLLCQQSGVTYYQTVAQVLENIENLTTASTLDGTETIFCRISGVSSKVTVDALAEFIIENG